MISGIIGFLIRQRPSDPNPVKKGEFDKLFRSFTPVKSVGDFNGKFYRYPLAPRQRSIGKKQMRAARFTIFVYADPPSLPCR